MSTNQSKIVSLDPSSTAVGFAVFQGREFVQAGLIKPDNASAESFERVVSMGDDVWSVLQQKDPQIILIEWTLGKVGQRRHHGGGAGLPVYGIGVGWIGCTCYRWIEEQFMQGRYGNYRQLIPIYENNWTNGVPKKTRQAAIASLYPSYCPERDPGGDIADAIGLADWWMREKMMSDD